MKIRTILDYLREFAPLSLAEDWDNTGLLIGSEDGNAERVLTCLTLTPDVAEEAVVANADLVITHHPVLFRAIKQLTDATAEGKMLLSLIAAGVAVYSPHTSYDSARSGINQQLVECLGLESIRPLRVADSDSDPASDNDPDGSGRCGNLPEQKSLSDLVDFVKEALAIEHTQFVGDPSQAVRRVGVACGSAAEFMHDATRLGCDALLTGEARFHACLEARTMRIGLILPGHYATERPAMEQLAGILAREFPDLTVSASEVESDPIRWA